MAERRYRQPAEPLEPSGNRLLAALPGSDYDSIRPYLDVVEVREKQELAVPNEPIEWVYFPIDTVTSVLALTSNGSRIEVATIGNEGVVGLPVFLGADASPLYAFAQVPGTAERMKAETFRSQVAHSWPLRELLQRYTQGFLTQVSQATVCNHFHSTEQRLARWLLAVQDRVRSEEFPLTHQFMGQMLGVRRETVSEVAGALQGRGLISYRRGRIRVRDREGLEAAACNCYRIVRDEYDRLLNAPVG